MMAPPSKGRFVIAGLAFAVFLLANAPAAATTVDADLLDRWQGSWHLVAPRDHPSISAIEMRVDHDSVQINVHVTTTDFDRMFTGTITKLTSKEMTIKGTVFGGREQESEVTFQYHFAGRRLVLNGYFWGQESSNAATTAVSWAFLKDRK